MDVSKKAITRITRLCDYFENADVTAGRKQKMSGSVEIRRAVGCISLWPCAMVTEQNTEAVTPHHLFTHLPVAQHHKTRKPCSYVHRE